MLVFCSRIGLEVLSKCTSMHGDGTFYVVAKYFYQLYLIHGWYNNYMIPCAWILMTKRISVDYKKAFRAITKAAREAKLAIKPKQIMTDRDMIVINFIF